MSSKKEKKSLLPMKYDVVFRMFFADERDTESLVSFLKSVLRIAEDEYDRIEIADPHLLKEYIGDKLSVIDVKLYTKSHKIIHIEIQLQVSESFKKRIMFYTSKLITEQLGGGGDNEDYDKIQNVISIVITDEPLIKESKKYKHRFTLYDHEAGVEFSDLVEVHTVELKKLPKDADGTMLYDWAQFIAAETEEELDMIAERNPEFGRAVIKLREMSADQKARDLFERRLKEKRDISMVKKDAKREGKKEGKKEGIEQSINAINMLKDGKSIEEVMESTGFSRSEVESLKQTLT